MPYTNSFVKNIEWPDEKETYRFQIISRNSDVKVDFERYAKTRRMNGKPIEVFFSDTPDNVFKVDVIYVDAEFNAQVEEIYEQIKGSQTLLITDQVEDERFIMINFMINENRTLDFEINKINILNQGIKILPDILFLAGNEVDIAKLYQEAQDSLQIMEDRMMELQKKYDSTEFNISVIQKTIHRQNLKIDEQLDEIYEKQTIINLQSILLDSLIKVYKNSESRLDSIGQNLDARELELIQLQNAIDAQSKQLHEGNETLEQQLVLIEKQDKEILSREFRLQEMITIVDSQQITLIYLILFLIVLLALAILIYFA
ncbi:MAG: YfiR/HmsC family protein, partial [Bacteroidota bacterium]